MCGHASAVHTKAEVSHGRLRAPVADGTPSRPPTRGPASGPAPADRRPMEDRIARSQMPPPSPPPPEMIDSTWFKL